MPDKQKCYKYEPKCPRCGADNDKLEHVSHIVEAAKVDCVGQSDVYSGDVYESYDPVFHHISCSACNTYWESKREFAKEFNEKYDTTD